MDLLLANTLGFPSPQAINDVFRRFAPDPKLHIGATLLPMKDNPTETIQWDVFGPVTGLTRPHVLGTDPKPIPMRKLATLLARTTYWKEFIRFQEEDFTRIRQAGTLSSLAGQQIFMEAMELLDARVEGRIEQLRWLCLQGGITISDVNDSGVLRTIDFLIPAANKVAAAAGGFGAVWTNHAAADPIADLILASNLLRGKSNGRPVAYLNSITAGHLAQNAVVRDLVKQSPVVMQMGRENVGEVITGLVGRMEKIVVYDEGFLDGDPEDGGNFVPFIPDGKVIIIGKTYRNQPLGSFRTTPSVHNGGPMNPRPGKFAFPEDQTNTKNPVYDLVGGVYGIPVLNFPENVVIYTAHA